MNLKKYLTKGLVLGILISHLPFYSFSNNVENKYYNELIDFQTKEDLQRAVKANDIDTWTTGLTNMPTARYYLTASVVNDNIYCIGGNKSALSFTNKLEVYNTKTDSWTTKTSMPTSRGQLTSAVVNGKIYCIGGQSVGFTNVNEVYDIATDSWATKTSMPTKRAYLSSVVIGDKIYCIGGGSGTSYINKVEVYDTTTDTWSTRAGMPSNRSCFVAEVVDGKIYCIGGSTVGTEVLNVVEVYDPATDTWETKTPMPTKRHVTAYGVVDSKIYIIGGRAGNTYLNIVEVYDTKTDSWSVKTSMPASRGYLSGALVDGRIYCIGGSASFPTPLNTVEVYTATESLEQKAQSSVINAESTKDPVDIEIARDLVNQLPEGELKTELENRLDAIQPNTPLENQNATSNIDMYISFENTLIISLDTNSITFEDFSGVLDMEKANAVNIMVTSTLPYQFNAYLPIKIQNSNKLNTMDKQILNIKENSESVYQTFVNNADKIVLKDNCIAGNDIKHSVDIKLKGSIAHEKDVYKTTIKLEVQQK